MYRIRIVTTIAAPAERCFDLARSVDAHVRSTGETSERAADGVTTGLLVLGDEVTWEARHFGIRQRFTARITQFDRPHYFQDRMVRGAFRSFEHDHRFEPQADKGTTRMIDELTFQAPLGPLGWLAERLFLARYLRRFLHKRAIVLQSLAESDEWKTYCP